MYLHRQSIPVLSAAPAANRPPRPRKPHAPEPPERTGGGRYRRIIARNWHCPFGEIDLIAEQSGTLLFVEVKYRRSTAFGGTAYSITPSKLAKLQKSAEYYLQQHRKGRTDCRLDAVLIEGGNPPVWLQNITG